MGSPSESSKAKPEGGRPAPDPLATPTLAALYASQGHTDLAQAIYATLGREPSRNDSAEPDQTFLQRLLALRQVARRLREAGRPGGEGSGG
jgi:hypothetical protein